MALSNHERVGKAMVSLGEGLAPFVARECEVEFGKNRTTGVQRADTRGDGRTRTVNPVDPQFLLKVMWDEWNTIFRKKLGRTERNYVSELQDARNKWAHNEAFTADSALRAMDTAKLLLESVGAGPHAAQVDKLYQELLRQRFEEQARKTQKKAASDQSPAQEKSLAQTGLPSWREVAEPHDDVASGRFQLAEFAADLHQVWRGDAPVEYDDPGHTSDEKVAISVNQLCSDIAQYLYLPRLVRRTVLEGDAGGSATAPVGSESAEDGDRAPSSSDGPAVPTRYYGRVTVGSDRWTRTAADIAEAIVNQLAQAEDAKIAVTIEVEATAEDGFDDNVQRTITENAATLKFNDSDFET